MRYSFVCFIIFSSLYCLTFQFYHSFTDQLLQYEKFQIYSFFNGLCTVFQIFEKFAQKRYLRFSIEANKDVIVTLTNTDEYLYLIDQQFMNVPPEGMTLYKDFYIEYHR